MRTRKSLDYDDGDDFITENERNDEGTEENKLEK